MGRDRRRRRAQRPHLCRLPRARRQVGARLERRERLGGACTLERPFEDDGYVVSPCAYVVGLLDELVIGELGLKSRGLRVDVADPNLWVPFEDGTTSASGSTTLTRRSDLEALGLSKKDIDGYWAYEHLFDEIRKRLRTGERDTWVGDSPSRAEIEELLRGEQAMIDIVFEASISEVLDEFMDDQRINDALFGQGVIGAWAARTTRARPRSSSCTTRATSRGRTGVGLRPRRHGDGLVRDRRGRRRRGSRARLRHAGVGDPARRGRAARGRRR